MADGQLEKPSQAQAGSDTGKASREANVHQRQPASEALPVSSNGKGPIAARIATVFDAIEAAESSGKSSIKYGDVLIEMDPKRKGVFKATTNESLQAKFNDLPVPGEPNTFLKEVSFPNTLKGTYVKNADGSRSLIGVSKGIESHVLTHRPIGNGGKALPLDVTLKFSDFQYKDNVLVGNYSTDVHFGIVPIRHPGTFTKQIWPLVAEETKAKPSAPKPVVPTDENTVADR